MHPPAYEILEGDGPLVAAAVHHGHHVRDELRERLAIAPIERLREEDPHTGDWTQVAPTRIVGHRSRFEFDLNRPRGRAVYRTPEDAWGLNVWREPPPPDELIERSLAEYDRFYADVEKLLARLIARHGRVVVFDLHSYNHRRLGPDAEPDPPELNPDINLGTGTLPPGNWSRVAGRFLEEASRRPVGGRRLDVRENVRFFGGEFPSWIHRTFGGAVCALAIEVKKFFMDEWAGRLDTAMHRDIQRLLKATADAILEEL